MFCVMIKKDSDSEWEIYEAGGGQVVVNTMVEAVELRESIKDVYGKKVVPFRRMPDVASSEESDPLG